MFLGMKDLRLNLKQHQDLEKRWAGVMEKLLLKTKE